MVVIWSNEETQKELAISVKEQKLPPSPSHTTCGLISNITLNMIKAKDPISFYTVNYNNLFLKKKNCKHGGELSIFPLREEK
jgi:hypothetical protein